MTDILADVRKITEEHRAGRMLVSCETSFRLVLGVVGLRGTLERIDRFINAVAPSRLTKEMDSIRTEVRAALAGTPREYAWKGDDHPPGWKRVGQVDVADPADLVSARNRGWRVGSVYDGGTYSVAEPCAADVYERLDGEPDAP